jgi:hypothetical protein
MTMAGALVNPRDNRSYRMPEWDRGPRTKILL